MPRWRPVRKRRRGVRSLTQTKKRSPLFLLFFGMQALVYAAHGVCVNYMSLALDHLGFTSGQIGTLMAIPPVIALIAQPMWGVIADKAKTKNRVLILMFGLAGLAVLAYNLGTSMMFFAVVMSIYAFFERPAMALKDGINLEAIEGTQYRFGPMRFGGSFGYIITMSLCGGIAATNPKALFIVGGLLTEILAIYCLLLPKVKGKGRGKQVSPWRLIKDWRVLRILIFSLIFGINIGFFDSFYGVYLTEQQFSGDTAGLLIGLVGISEIPFLLFGHKLPIKKHMNFMMVATGLLQAVRWILLFIGGGFGLQLVLQLFTSWTATGITVTGQEYLNSTVPDELKASAQMLQGMMAVTLGNILGNVIGGWAGELFSLQATFLGCAALAVIGVTFFAVTAHTVKKVEVQ